LGREKDSLGKILLVVGNEVRVLLRLLRSQVAASFLFLSGRG
jgi:hypothetical protein